MKRLILVASLAVLVSCGDRGPSAGARVGPSPTSPTVPTTAGLVVFTERGTNFSTTDLRDAQDQILQIDALDELIWTPDGTRLPGYHVETMEFSRGFFYFVTGNICREGCQFEVRFGTKDGERRAYLTVDYGHDNPGTMVDVEVAARTLVVSQTSLYPPGTPTLTGIVSEVTSNGAEVPVEGATVYRGVSTGWRSATTDRDGLYTIRGLLEGTDTVAVFRDGHEQQRFNVSISGDTRFDIHLRR